MIMYCTTEQEYFVTDTQVLQIINTLMMPKLDLH